MNSLWSNAYEISNIVMEVEETEDDARVAELEKELIDIAKAMVMSEEKKEPPMEKSFDYGSICREDVLYVVGEKHRKMIENLTDSDMNDLANRMYDGCIENYWNEVLADAFNTLFEKEE